ncbi:efflux RND transporter periplasmic adaptor subunit [Azospira restricta]|uniref:Efflux RND transporter periplasmic adaptor subunit n=1 Tax=Azospira restricta TaxID=404405 RepID=A0A974SSL0_9RHOO|nr:efflux RND transporter periplasmic adaptor subunit [Azospira restricta]
MGLVRGIFLTALGGAQLWASAHATGFDCLIEANQLIELASPVSGLLEKVTVKRGDIVRKGQILAQLESRAEQASTELARYKSEQLGPVRMAESKLEFSKRKFVRRKDMAAEKLMSPQERDDAEAEYSLAEAELVVAKDNKHLARIEYQQQGALLALRTIRSPFDGVVVDQLAYPGEVVELGSSRKAILKVAQLDPLRVHVILPKEVFGKLTVGMSVEVTPETNAKGRYAAKVRSIDKVIDAASGTFVVFLDLPNPKLEIPAGIKCRTALTGIELPASMSRNKSSVSANQ